MGESQLSAFMGFFVFNDKVQKQMVSCFPGALHAALFLASVWLPVMSCCQSRAVGSVVAAHVPEGPGPRLSWEKPFLKQPRCLQGNEKDFPKTLKVPLSVCFPASGSSQM